MPALITHHLFGEESIDRLPQGVIASDEERIAFILGNQGPDPFFFHMLTPRVSDCTLLAQVMHRSRMSRQFSCLRDGVSHLQPRDASLGRAFALGLLSHYVLDRNAHPFVYEQQFGIVESDPELEASGSQVHAVLESDLDVLMLQLKRDGATVEDYPPAGEIVTTDRINRVAGVLMSYVAGRVYGIDIPAEKGTPILAAADGTVTEIGFDTQRGNYIVLDHGGGLETLYGQCRDILDTLAEGDTVSAGEMIAAVGSSGMSTGPHLHFEVLQDGEPQNPVAYFDSAVRDTLWVA